MTNPKSDVQEELSYYPPFEVAGMPLLNPASLGLNKRINEMGDIIDQALEVIRNDIGNLIVDVNQTKTNVAEILRIPKTNSVKEPTVETGTSTGDEQKYLNITKLPEAEGKFEEAPRLRKKSSGSKYHANSALNLNPRGNFSFSTREEMEVREIWPQIVLPHEARDYGETASKNKVTIPITLRLIRADREIFKKLGEMQDLLRIALILYCLWLMRIALEMSGDYQQVAIWANQWHVSWAEFVKAIIDVLRNHGCLFSSVTSFTMLLPYCEEAYINFAWRLRDAFYMLPLDQQDLQGIWHILVGKLQEHIPSTWLSNCDLVHPGMHASELIELAVQRAQLVTRVAVESKIYSTPETVVNLEGNSAPHYELKISESTPSRPRVAKIVQPNAIPIRTTISDSRSDDRMVFTTNEPLPPDNNYAAHEKDNKCFNCGKSGHWAMNCQSKVKSSNVKNIVPEGENITIRGKLFKSPGFAQKAKRTFEIYKKRQP
ncbi:hypothetical protein K3495_g3297 [Podosphaera aphanis]|nr:hypothetical protein K3495_g3297 [Podosphaera aphanis]